MSRIVDDDPPIKTGVTSQAYRDNWDRIFGEKEPDPRVLCGETDHEKIEALGTTVTGCPEVPPGTALIVPTKEQIKAHLAAGGEPGPDTDAIECTLKSYANMIAHGPTVSIPVDVYFIPRHLDNTEAECRNGARELPLSFLEDHDCCYTCNDFAADPSVLIKT